MLQRKARAPERGTSADEIDLRNYTDFGRRIARCHAHFFGGDSAEAESATFFAMLQAKQTWQPGAGASFGSFLLIIARREIFRAAARRQRQNGVARRHRFDAGPAAKQPQQSHSFALISIDVPIVTGSDDTIGALLPDGDTPDPEVALAAKQESAAARQRIAAALPVLTERERAIIEAHFLGDEPATVRDIARQLGISHQRVHAIEAKAFGKLRDALSGQPVAHQRDIAAARTARERRIFEARIEAPMPVTQNELARELGCSHARVAQIEKELRRKLARVA